MPAAKPASVSPYVRGAGLGLRRSLLAPLAELQPSPGDGIGFFEVAPENWMRLGGKFARQFRQYTERFAFVTHGLSLSIGSPAALDEDFVRQLKTFLDAHGIQDYTEHLTFCSDEGHLYDLMPIPFTAEAVEYVAARVRRVQDILERRIALENASYYAPLATDLTEAEQVTLLAESLEGMKKERAEGKNSTQDLITAYISGEPTKVASEMDRMMQEMAKGEHKELGEKLMKRLLADRDKNMADFIAGILNEQPATSHFFAAGALHFCTDTSIPSHLKKAGYTVTRIDK